MAMRPLTSPTHVQPVAVGNQVIDIEPGPARERGDLDHAVRRTGSVRIDGESVFEPLVVN